MPGGNAETLFRFRFQTDGSVHLAGVFLDDFVVKSGGTTLFTDDVETGEDGWTAEGGLKISTGSEVDSAIGTTSPRTGPTSAMTPGSRSARTSSASR